MSGPRPSGPLRAPLHRIDARSRLRVANSVRAQDPHPRSPHGTGWGWGASVGVDRAHSRVRAIILITLNRLNSPRPPGGLGISDVTIRATGREHRFRRRGVFRGCLGCFPWVSYVRWPGRPSSNIGLTKRRTGGRTMREIGLVLLSIAMMALLRTDADAKRRSSAQGSQAAGASRSWCAVHPRHGSENCGYTSFDQCWATIGAEGGWCRPNPFSATPYGTGYTWSGPKR